MATAFNRYIFSITLRQDARDSAVEVTAMLDSDEAQLLALHAETDPSSAAVFSGVLDIAQSQTVTHAKYRVDGDEVASSTPVADGLEATDTVLSDLVLAVKTTFAEHTAADDDDNDSAIATSLNEIQGLPGPVAALKGLGQTDSALSSCLDLSLSDIKKVASNSELNIADPPTPALPVSQAAADHNTDIVERDAPAAEFAQDKSASDDEYVVVTTEDSADLAVLATNEAKSADADIASAPSAQDPVTPPVVEAEQPAALE
ncbi:hypothetical protein LPJ63_004572, partial [Coemansia sp. RSA 2711]